MSRGGRKKRGAWWAFLACIVIGGAGVVLTLFIQYRLFDARRRYVPARATIESHRTEQYTEWKRYSSRKKLQSKIVYHYVFHDRVYTGSCISLKTRPLVDGFSPGEIVPCHVDPADPRRAMLMLEADSPWWMLVCGEILLAVGIWGFASCRREAFVRKRNRELFEALNANCGEPPPDLPWNTRNSGKNCGYAHLAGNGFGVQFRRGVWLTAFWGFLLFLSAVVATGGAYLLMKREYAGGFLLALGLLFLGLGLFRLFFGGDELYRFDRKEGFAWRGQRGPRESGNPEKLAGFLRFDEIRCLQLVVRISRGTKNALVQRCELAMVKKGGGRVPLALFMDLRRGIADARRLSGFLDVPLFAKWFEEAEQ